jgi:Tol biopolymer transport system component
MLACVSIMLMCRPLVAIWACTLALASPSPALSAGAPVSAAVIVHTDRDDRLAIADLTKGSYEVVGTASAADPVWSPDGMRLAYRQAEAVFLMSVTDHHPKRLLAGIDPSGPGAYAFSPDSRRLAVATTSGLEFWSIEAEPARKLATAPTKLRFKDLIWAPNGKRVAACGWNGREGDESRESLQVFEVTADAARPEQQRPTRGCRLLGVRQDKWLIKSAVTDRLEEVVGVGADGKGERLLPIPEYRHADRYLALVDAVLLVHEAEDTGEPTQIDLAPLSGVGRLRPWLRKWKRLAEYSLSSDGKYVLFTQLSSNGERKGGDIYLATADGANPRRVLPGPDSKKATFSQPTPRPSP